MRVLITANGGAGHIGPVLPFAHAFRRAGDEVLIAAPVSSRAFVMGAGLRLHALPDPPRQEIDAVMAPFPWLPPAEQGVRMMRDVFAGIKARASLPRMLRAVADYAPDVVLSEPTEYAGRLAAERFGVPSGRIGIMAAATESWTVPVVAPVLDEHRARLGTAPDPDGRRLDRSPYLTVFPEPLEEPGSGAEALRFREPAAEPWPLPDWWDGDDRPLVYATYGSEVPRLPGFPATYRATVGALGELPVRALLTVGTEVDLDRLGRPPANVHVERWVPQSRVMPHAALVIGHGGAGTTRLALAAGVPSVVFPSFADQPRNARRIAELGAGIALEALDGLGDAVMRVLSEPSHRAAAGWAAARIATAPLVDEAPALLRERLVIRAAA